MKRNLKVLVSVVLILSIVFSIAGCSSKDVAGVKEEEEEEDEEEDYDEDEEGSEE